MSSIDRVFALSRYAGEIFREEHPYYGDVPFGVSVIPVDGYAATHLWCFLPWKENDEDTLYVTGEFVRSYDDGRRFVIDIIEQYNK